MDFSLISPDDSRWDSILTEVQHEFYHLPGYTVLEAKRMGGQPGSLWISSEEARILVPLVIRSIPCNGTSTDNTMRDACSPYGYPGPLVSYSSSNRDSIVSDALEAVGAELGKAGIVSAFVRLNPLDNDYHPFETAGTLVEHGSTVWLDLTLSEEELHRQVRKRFRSNINSAIRDGVNVRWDDDWLHFDDFLKLYYLTMERVNAEEWYYFSKEYFLELKEVLGERLKLCLVESDGKLFTAGLFSCYGKVVQYLFSGTNEELDQPHASKLMMVWIRNWAKENGFKTMHLGGGLGGSGDSLSWFKRGFSKLEVPFYTWRLICDRVAYDKLVDKWRKLSGTKGDSIDGFFPAYRKPFPTVG